MKPIVNIKFLADLKQFSSQMQNANRRLEATGRKLASIGSQLTVGLTLPIVAAGTAAVKFASDYEESLNKVDVAFGQSGDAVEKYAKTTLKQFGIAEGSALDMAALFGDMATSMQIPQQEAAKMSTSLVSLAGDLASFKNIGISEATTALNAVFTGETESLKRLGVVMTQANLQQFAMTQGISKSIKEMTEAEKVQLRYAFVMERTSNAQGDFARTGGGASNQMRVFTESLKQLGQQFGAQLLPSFTKVVTKINEVVDWISKLTPETKKFIVIVAGVAAAIGPLLALAGTILPAIATGFAILTGPIGLIAAGLTAIGVIIYKNWEPIKQTLVDIANYFIDLYNESTAFRIVVEHTTTSFKNLWSVGKYVFGALGEIISAVWKSLKEGVQNFGKVLKAILTGDLQAIPGIIKDNFEQGMFNAIDAIDGIKSKFGELKDVITENIEQGIGNALNGKKYELLPDAVDATEASEKVADQIAKGVEKGLTSGGDGRAKVSSLNVSGLTQGLQVQSPLKLAAETIGTHVRVLSEQQQIALQNAVAFNEGFTEIIKNTANNFAIGFGELLGDFATGNASIGDLGSMILGTIGDLAIQLGKMAISIGITVGAIKAALESLNPFVAIAAGVALVALGTAVKNQIPKLAGGGSPDIPAFANGGVVGGSSFYGDRILARLNSGELVLNQNHQRNLEGLLNDSPSEGGEVVFRIGNSELIGTLKRGLKGNSRGGGNIKLNS